MHFYTSFLFVALSLTSGRATADQWLLREIKINQTLHKLSSGTEAALAHDVDVASTEAQVGRQRTREIVRARAALAIDFDVAYLSIPDPHVAEELVDIAGTLRVDADAFDDCEEELRARSDAWRLHHEEVRAVLREVDRRLATLIQISNERLSAGTFSRRAGWNEHAL